MRKAVQKMFTEPAAWDDDSYQGTLALGSLPLGAFMAIYPIVLLGAHATFVMVVLSLLKSVGVYLGGVVVSRIGSAFLLRTSTAPKQRIYRAVEGASWGWMAYASFFSVALPIYGLFIGASNLIGGSTSVLGKISANILEAPNKPKALPRSRED